MPSSARSLSLPLIALGYICFVAGLLAGFGGIAWIAVPAAVCGLAVATARREMRTAALALMLIGGAMIAITTSRPAPFSRRHDATRIEAGYLESMRARAARSIDATFGDNAPMARALLIADQHGIPPETRDRYARAGMVHMLSISGLHVAIIAGAVILVLEAARVPRNAASMLAVAITGWYVAIIGAPAPAVRSAVMLAMVAASRATQRPTSPWAGLAAGAFVPLIAPATILDLGYQLSVVGIGGLIASASLAKRVFPRGKNEWKTKVGGDLLTSTVATVVTAPLIAWHFGRISLIAPFANLAAGPVISILQPLLFLSLALAPVRPLAAFLADAARPLIGLFDGIARVAAELPAASIPVVPSLATVVLGGVVIVALIAACMSRYPIRYVVIAAASLCAVVWVPPLWLRHSGEMEMHVLDVGQGDAILIRTERGRWIIFDAGRVWKSGDAGRSTIIPYIMSRGGAVEAFVLSHAHSDHAGGAVSIMRALRPRVFWDSAYPQGSAVYDATLRAALETGIEWARVDPGDSIRLDGVVVRFLAPDSAWTASLADPNDASTVAVVEYGSSRFLLVGDAEREEEEWLLHCCREALRADVLKVGHHGSSTSSGDAFLGAVNPSLAVISVGADNLYGHPSRDVLAALDRVGAVTVRTDRSGTVVVRSDGSRMTYEAGGEHWDISRH